MPLSDSSVGARGKATPGIKQNSVLAPAVPIRGRSTAKQFAARRWQFREPSQRVCALNTGVAEGDWESVIDDLQVRAVGSADSFKSVYTWASHRLDFLPPPIDSASRSERTGVLCEVLDQLMVRICSEEGLWARLRGLLHEAIYVDGDRLTTRDVFIDSQGEIIGKLGDQIDAQRTALRAARRITDDALAKAVATSIRTVFIAWRTVASTQRGTRRKLDAVFSKRNALSSKHRRFLWWKQLAMSAKLRRAVRQQVIRNPRTRAEGLSSAVMGGDPHEVQLMRQRLSEESHLRDRQFEAFSYEVSNLNADVVTLTQQLRQCQGQKALWRSLWLTVHSDQCLVWDIPVSLRQHVAVMDSAIEKFLAIPESAPELDGFTGQQLGSLRRVGIARSQGRRRKSSVSSEVSGMKQHRWAEEQESARLLIRGKLEGFLVQWVNSMITHREELMEYGDGEVLPSGVTRSYTLGSLKEDLHDGEIYSALLDSIEIGVKYADFTAEGRGHREECSRSPHRMVAGAQKLTSALHAAVNRGSGGFSCLPPWCQSLLSSCPDKALRDLFDDETVLFGDDLSHLWILATLFVDFVSRLESAARYSNVPLDPTHKGLIEGLPQPTRNLLRYNRFYAPCRSAHASFRSRSSQLTAGEPCGASDSGNNALPSNHPGSAGLLAVETDIAGVGSRVLTARRSTVAPRGSFRTQPPQSHRPSIFEGIDGLPQDENPMDSAGGNRVLSRMASPTVSHSSLMVAAGDTIQESANGVREGRLCDVNGAPTDDIPQISISMGFEEMDEGILDARSVSGGSDACTPTRSLTSSPKLGSAGAEEILSPHCATVVAGEEPFVHAVMDAGSYYLEGVSNRLPLANPKEQLTHLRWYRESFDPSAPLATDDYLRPLPDVPDADVVPLFITHHSRLGVTEHPPFIPFPDILATVGSNVVDHSYDAAQWYRIHLEASRRRGEWLRLGRMVSMAVVGCRSLDSIPPRPTPELVPGGTASVHSARSRQHSRNHPPSDGSQVSRQNSNLFASAKRSLSNSRRSGSAGSNSSVKSGRQPLASNPQSIRNGTVAALLTVTRVPASQAKRI